MLSGFLSSDCPRSKAFVFHPYTLNTCIPLLSSMAKGLVKSPPEMTFLPHVDSHICLLFCETFEPDWPPLFPPSKFAKPFYCVLMLLRHIIKLEQTKLSPDISFPPFFPYQYTNLLYMSLIYCFNNLYTIGLVFDFNGLEEICVSLLRF